MPCSSGTRSKLTASSLGFAPTENIVLDEVLARVFLLMHKRITRTAAISSPLAGKRSRGTNRTSHDPTIAEVNIASDMLTCFFRMLGPSSRCSRNPVAYPWRFFWRRLRGGDGDAGQVGYTPDPSSHREMMRRDTRACPRSFLERSSAAPGGGWTECGRRATYLSSSKSRAAILGARAVDARGGDRLAIGDR